jgi:hypothetical protein
MAPKAGTSIKSNTQETLLKEKNREQDVLNLTVDSTREILSMESFKGKANITLQTRARCMKANS